MSFVFIYILLFCGCFFMYTFFVFVLLCLFFCACVVVFIFFCVCVLLCLYSCVCVVVSRTVGSSRSGGHSCYNSYKQPPCSRRFDIQQSFIYSKKIILTDTAGKVDPFK